MYISQKINCWQQLSSFRGKSECKSSLVLGATKSPFLFISSHPKPTHLCLVGSYLWLSQTQESKEGMMLPKFLKHTGKEQCTV